MEHFAYLVIAFVVISAVIFWVVRACKLPEPITYVVYGAIAVAAIYVVLQFPGIAR